MVKKVIFFIFTIIVSVNLFANSIDEKELKKNAQNGDSKSQYQLGLFYQMKKNDDKKALIWYKKSAKNGNKDAILALHLFKEVVSLRDDSYIKKSESNSVEITTKSIELKNVENSEHFKLLKLKANSGDHKSQYQLGLIFSNGYGVKVDSEKALKWYKLASQRGNQDAILAYKLLKEAL